jgi:hypothetical protein
MPETSQIIFSHKEVVEALIKQQDIHEGIWTLLLQFGIQGANVALGSPNLVPAAIVPVVGIGLQKADQVTNMSVDAAIVNPAPAQHEDGEFN